MLLVSYLMALVAGPLVVVTQLVTVDGVKIVSRLTDPAASHARLRVGRMLTALILTKASASCALRSGHCKTILTYQYESQIKAEIKIRMVVCT